MNVVTKVLFGMIVRERRRIAALARTASSLDERLQAAEKDVSVSESAFRTYVEEQSEEVTALSFNQQEHILSLMDMVKEESEQSMSTSKPINQGSNRDARGKCLEGVAESTMLVLANERIAVLGQSLESLKSRENTYRKKTEEVGRSFQSKSNECEDLHDELTELRAIMREIKAKVGKQGDCEDPSVIVEQLKETLHLAVPSGSRRGSEERRGSSRGLLSSHFKHVDFLNVSSDGDEGEETPEWASDIMADLALIAEGKVPPSLEGTMAITADKKTKSQPKSTSVFDRLADPQSFTGTQKLSQAAQRDMVDVQKNASLASSTRGQQDRIAMSREISVRLDKIVVPGDEGTATIMTKESDQDGKKHANNNESDPEDLKNYKSVFERLQSPSQYTGTQKDKYNARATRTKRSKPADDAATKPLDEKRKPADDAATRLLDDLLGTDNDEGENEASNSASLSVYNEYTQLNVFERLQKTTTQAYAVKHGGGLPHDSMLYDGSSPPSGASTGTSVKREETKNVSSDSTRQDVFERLTKTTTEAYANKANRTKREQY
jgi:hypothetical protein